MASLRSAFLLLLLLAAVLAAAGGIHGATGGAWESETESGNMTCSEGVGCGSDDEIDDAEEGEDGGGRRVLVARRRRYLSYDMMKRNQVPCNHRGVSYYNCNHRGRANPYRRGCSYITRCSRDLR
ncbi:hypothetical protein HPP92_003616 [Vanilla planifolia]|uniref:Uncharacterized protein n=1 Tax=Vanilla planifolia TaxID=51239 RepID=A0A835VJ45_VANPL|nr:hypothetical protein HPP92_003616 [Vanilla planifolia]